MLSVKKGQIWKQQNRDKLVKVVCCSVFQNERYTADMVTFTVLRNKRTVSMFYDMFISRYRYMETLDARMTIGELRKYFYITPPKGELCDD